MTQPPPPPPHGGGGLAVQILALGTDLARLRVQLDDLTGIGEQVVDLADDIAAVREQLQALLGTDDRPARVWDWSAAGMNRQAASVAWSTLVDWVRDVLAGMYGAVGETGGRKERVPSCWYLHPDAVAELSWLCQEWLRTYRSDKGTPGSAAEWHDRWLPGVITRLNSVTSTADCVRNMGRHTAPRAAQPIADESALNDAVRADLAGRATEQAP